MLYLRATRLFHFLLMVFWLATLIGWHKKNNKYDYSKAQRTHHLIFIVSVGLCKHKCMYMTCLIDDVEWGWSATPRIACREYIPTNSRRLANAGLMLGHCRRQWLNIKPELAKLILPYQVWPSDYQSDLDNRCALQLYEREGVWATWIFIMTSPVYWRSVEVTLRSECSGCLNWPGRIGVLNS